MILNEELSVFSGSPPETAENIRTDTAKELIWDADVEMCLLRPELIWQDYLVEDTQENTKNTAASVLAEIAPVIVTPATTTPESLGESLPPTYSDSPSAVAPISVSNESLMPDNVVKAIEQAITQEAPEEKAGGPVLAELLATRAELRRLEVRCLELESMRRTTGDTLTRQNADFENFRRRVTREREDFRQSTVCEIARQILPLLDNLTRALEIQNKPAAGNDGRFVQGVVLIARQLEEVLMGLGVRMIPAVGHPFDPQIHEAVALDYTSHLPPNTVTEELLRGYWLGERLIRAAIVKVSAKV